MMNQKRGLDRLSKVPDGDPWAPINLLTSEQKKNTSWTPVKTLQTYSSSEPVVQFHIM